MKRMFLLGVATLLLTLSADAHVGGRMSFGVFYGSLAPYGDWIELDDGMYAWRPVGVRHGWRPYTVGRWVWTRYGWYWHSSEPWGWAAYHYGRWHYDEYYGWIWIPGYEWAPAWVEWRYGGDYVGWAPLGPYAVFSISIGIYYPRHWVTPHHYWSFVHCGYLTSPSIHRYVYRTEHNTRYIGRTRGGGTIHYNGGRISSRGPERDYVERRGRSRIETEDIEEVTDHRVDRNGGDDLDRRIRVYRPDRAEAERETAVERPERVIRGERRVDLDLRRTDIGMRQSDRERGERSQGSDAVVEPQREELRQRELNEERGIRRDAPEREQERVREPEVRRPAEDAGRTDRAKDDQIRRERERTGERPGVTLGNQERKGAELRRPPETERRRPEAERRAPEIQRRPEPPSRQQAPERSVRRGDGGGRPPARERDGAGRPPSR